MSISLKKISACALAAGALFAAFGASAATFQIEPGSRMTDFRRIGVSINDAGSVTTDPTTWDKVDADMTTNFIMEPFAPVLLGGSITVTGGVVTAATLIQLTSFQIGNYQSASSQANFVANGIIWTLDFATNRLLHQTGTLASCVLVNGAGSSPGSCSASATNTASNSDILRFDGMAANYSVRDSITNPLSGNGGTLTVLNIGGPSGKAGITWDLSMFDENAGGGVIRAVAIADQFSAFQAPNFNGASAAFFTLTTVPVPAAVWFFGSAIALLAGLRRRLAA